MNKDNQAVSDEKKQQKFFTPIASEWLSLEESQAEIVKEKTQENKNSLREMLLSALQMPNLVVLSGSGTSLGNVGGPSMWNLWDVAVNENAGAPDSEPRTQTTEAQSVITKIRFINPTEGKDKDNIEALLSHCEAWLQINHDDTRVKDFIKKSKEIILDKCQRFLKDDKLEAHRTFLHKLSRRSGRNPRLKIFTTNYDLCFERAAALQSLIVVDGFSFTQPRTYNPLYFGYDIVSRSRLTEERGDYLDGVFHLLKLHGSVNWVRTSEGVIQEQQNPDPDQACLIYPARGKYQQSFLQPHLELVSQFFSSLREPNTCLIIAGFGFNDDHLSEPIIAAVKSNPHLKLIVVDYCAEDSTNGNNTKASRYWGELFKLELIHK
jgi:SIR2-like domain